VAERDEPAVTDFIERFAAVLIEAGFPRMAARAFVAILASESGRLTAAQLADRLQASPAAISGAVRFLIQLNLATRLREPRSRRDYYVVDDDVWFRVIDTRLNAIHRWGDQLAAGTAAVGRDSDAGRRLADMVAFFDFMRNEMPSVLHRWHELRAEN
jgi:DNA-binding transcriptional regulator GbsR (MarR family)